MSRTMEVGAEGEPEELPSVKNKRKLGGRRLEGNKDKQKQNDKGGGTNKKVRVFLVKTSPAERRFGKNTAYAR